MPKKDLHKKVFSSSATSSDPCASYIAQTKIADPSDPNCTSFIACQNGAQVGLSTSCAPGTKFSFALQYCDHATNVHDCGNSSTTTCLIEENVGYNGPNINHLGEDLKQNDAESCQSFCESNYPAATHFTWIRDLIE